MMMIMMIILIIIIIILIINLNSSIILKIVFKPSSTNTSLRVCRNSERYRKRKIGRVTNYFLLLNELLLLLSKITIDR